MTIQEAWEEVLQIRGSRETCVTIELWQFPSGNRRCQLKLWDGTTHHEATDLKDLIQCARSIAEQAEVIDGELPRMGGEDEPS